MKKVLKNRIFIIVILCIINCGIGIYAASKYNANEVLYNPSNGDSMTVNEALNELYNNIDKNQCKLICNTNEAKVGDYVRMTPTSTLYTISKDLTGYTSDQIIDPSELNLWRIIKINEDRTIEMVSEYVSSIDIYFKGKTGYSNFVGVLNEIASKYENSKYTISSRIMGYGGQTEYITDTSKITYPAPWTSSTSDNSNETLGGGDMMYENDTNLVSEVIGTLVATNPSGTKTDYWIGSRNYFYNTQTKYYRWYARFVNDKNQLVGYSLYGFSDTGLGALAYSSAIRPIIILDLKTKVNTTGRGTSEDPWVLE